VLAFGDGTSLALQIAVGVSLLMLGRKLYWLFVAAVGFVAATALVAAVFEPESQWVGLAAAVAAGLVGALAAIFLQRIAVAVTGFVALAYLVWEVGPEIGLDGQVQTVAMLVAGVVGAIFASLLFDWALIFLSSLVGAAILVEAFGLEQQATIVVMVVLAVAGISIQANMLKRDKGKPV